MQWNPELISQRARADLGPISSRKTKEVFFSFFQSLFPKSVLIKVAGSSQNLFFEDGWSYK